MILEENNLAVFALRAFYILSLSGFLVFEFQERDVCKVGALVVGQVCGV